MAKLTRIIQKIFGSDGGSGEFGQFGSNAASPPGSTTKDLTVIQSLQEYLDGWYAATANANEPPRIQDRNALDLLFSSQLTYLFQNGIPEWLDDADQRYYVDVSFVTKGGVIYVAIQGDDAGNINAEKDPETEPTWWTPLLEALEDAIDLNTAAAALNTTHRGSDGKDHSDVVANTAAAALNTTHRGSNGSDHGFIDQDVSVEAGPTFKDGKKLLTSANIITSASISESDVFDKLSPFLPTTGDKMAMTGGTVNVSALHLIVFYAERVSPTIIRIHGMRVDSTIVSFSSFVEGGAINQAVHVSW